MIPCCKRLLPLGLSLALWFGVASSSIAAEKSDHGGGNPDVLELRFDLGIWTIVVFVALLLVLKKYAWGPILDGLKKREENIRTAAEEAKKARDEMDRLRSDFQVELARAHEQIPRLMEEARKDAQRLAEEMRTRAQAEIQADRQRLRREIELAVEQSLQEIYNRVAQLATLISTKAIQRSLTEEDHRRLVDVTLAELRQAKA
jgi:F-type H+-transporting ATPase subunit b